MAGFPVIVDLEKQRVLGTYYFEPTDGRQNMVCIVADGDVPTEEALDMAERLIAMKREELSKANAGPARTGGA